MNTWTMPRAVVEKFVANEYIAACWTLRCEVMGSSASVADKFNDKETHRLAFCGQEDHYAIHLDDNGTPTDMIEIRTDNLGDLPCQVYTDDSYSAVRAIADVSEGEYIYWTTTSGSRVWHHAGTVSGTSNHS